MRLPLTLAALLVAAPLFAGDKKDPAVRERQVKVALALAEAKGEPAKKDADRSAKVAVALELAGQPSPPPFVTIPVVAPAPMPRLKCECDTTGECKCPPGGCSCCERPLPDYATQARAAVKLGKPLVCYVGCKGHCLDGALACETKADGTEAAGVEVLIPKANGNLWSAFRLPCDASPEAIRSAVQSATKALATQPKGPATPAKVSTAPEVRGSVPFTLTTPAPGAGRTSTSSSGFYSPAGTFTPAPGVGFRGSISGSVCVGRA